MPSSEGGVQSSQDVNDLDEREGCNPDPWVEPDKRTFPPEAGS